MFDCLWIQAQMRVKWTIQKIFHHEFIRGGESWLGFGNVGNFLFHFFVKLVNSMTSCNRKYLCADSLNIFHRCTTTSSTQNFVKLFIGVIEKLQKCFQKNFNISIWMPQNCLNVECASANNLNCNYAISRPFIVGLIFTWTLNIQQCSWIFDNNLQWICTIEMSIGRGRTISDSRLFPPFNMWWTFTSQTDKVDDLSLSTAHTHDTRVIQFTEQKSLIFCRLW